MNSDRFLILRGRIVQLLKMADGRLYPERSLLADATNIVYPPMLKTEFDHVIARMEDSSHLLRVANDDEGTKCKLTELGHAEL